MILTEMQKSTLREVANIGAGHAAIAFSQLLGKKIMISIPAVEIFPFGEIKIMVKPDGSKFTLSSVSVFGDCLGLMIFLLQDHVALRLCDLALDQPPGTTKQLTPLEESAVKEISSILSSAYLNAVSEMTGLSLIISVPQYYFGQLSLIDEILAKKHIAAQNIKREVLCIKTEFLEAATKIEGYLILIPLDDTVEKILKALKI